MMNRQMRRAMASKGGMIPGQLGQAADQLQGALAALQSMKGLEAMAGQVAEAHQLVVDTHATVSALVEDNQGMADEIEALKAMVFMLMGDGAAEAFRRHVERIKAQRAEEATSTGTA